MKDKTANILISILLVLITASIGVCVWLLVSQNKYVTEITVELEEQTYDELEVYLTDIHPGSSNEYTINLKANQGDAFDVTLGFERKGKEELAPFLNVAFIVDGEELLSKNLKECLEESVTLPFRCKFTDTDTVVVKVVYTMELDVGDDAQGAEANFNLTIDSTR